VDRERIRVQVAHLLRAYSSITPAECVRQVASKLDLPETDELRGAVRDGWEAYFRRRVRGRVARMIALVVACVVGGVAVVAWLKARDDRHRAAVEASALEEAERRIAEAERSLELGLVNAASEEYARALAHLNRLPPERSTERRAEYGRRLRAAIDRHWEAIVRRRREGHVREAEVTRFLEAFGSEEQRNRWNLRQVD
jgi:hypothetical protein